MEQQLLNKNTYYLWEKKNVHKFIVINELYQSI